MKKLKNIETWKKIVVLLLIVGFLGSGFLLLWAATLKTPDFDTLENYNRRVAQSTKIYDQTGEVLLYDIHENAQRTIVPYNDISHYIKNAAVAIEDEEFYEHIGIKPTAIFRAVLVNIGALGFAQGGSTITQQVVKNTLLTQEKTIARKLKEWILALKVERSMSKNRILTLYLNEAPYGGSIYGVEAASEAFFGKSANEVTLAEAAYMAALPQAPTYYSPYGNNTDALEERKNTVLDRMKALGFITEEEYQQAHEEEVEFLPRPENSIKAPHFTFYVRSYLEQKYGKEVVEYGGLRVTTTLDYSLQQKAQEIVREAALRNEERFNAENASLVATDPKTGQILVMVGSRDYFDPEIDGNVNVAVAHRQPGSAFKPFVYATAFEEGYTPETVVFDLPTQFQTTCTPEGEPLGGASADDCYSPSNYDGEFRGPITLRNALAQSVNVPAVKTLYLAGLGDSLQTAKKFGLSTLTNANQYGLTLVLGGGEVRLLDMTNAYGVFANEGVRHPHTPILKVEDKNGNVLEQYTRQPEQIIDPEVTRKISDILSDNEARAPLYGRNSLLHFPERDVAAKTGTTNDYIDAWILGYTPNISVGVWAGNNTPESMNQISGLIVTPMWREFMDEALKTIPKEHFNEPKETPDNLKPILSGTWQGGEAYEIDTISGKLATPLTPPETRERKVVREVHSILYWLDKNNPRGEKPKNPEQDSQFNLWETPVRNWVEELNIQEQNSDTIPDQEDDVHTKDKLPSVDITNPESNATINKQNRVSVSVTTSSSYPVQRVEYFMDGTFIGSSETPPFNISFVPAHSTSASGLTTLRAVVIDSVYNRSESKTSFYLR